MLILASASPRRRDLLLQAGLRFEVLAADIDEARRANEAPIAYVERVALEKALSIHALHPAATVLGADTTVVLPHSGSTGDAADCAEEILSKPTGAAEAERMLRALSGRVHQVHTGVAVVTPTRCLTHVETTAVQFGEIAEDDLTAYLASGDSLDKAGGYGVQGYAARWITRIEGDFYNVVGLPIAAVIGLLRQTEGWKGGR